MFFLVLPRLLFEAFIDAIYFPFWWYTAGAKHAFLWCLSLLQSGNDNFAPGLWLKNIFVPMFGQYDIQGRIISFLMRLAQVVGRTFALFIWFLISFILFLCW